MAENDKVLKAIERLSGKVGDVTDAVQTLATHVDKQIERVRQDLGGRIDKVDGRLDKVEGQIGKLRSDLIDHVSKQAANTKGDIIKTIKSDREKHTLFHLKVLNIFERNNLVLPEEVDALKEFLAP